MSNPTYAQNNEDIRLWCALYDCPYKNYVDIGAGHPSELSVTKIFYDAGWRGVNVEPGPNFDLLVAERPEDININAAVSDSTGTATFYVSDLHPDLSSLGRQTGNTVLVETIRLDSVMSMVPIAGFLKIDVEGHEREVLSSNAWEWYRPWVICVEAITWPDATPSHEAWEPDLLDKGYTFAYFDGINRFYARTDHPRLIERLQVELPTLPNYPRN